MRLVSESGRTKRGSGLLLVLAAALLIAGCGGTKSLSHSALVNRADSVCQSANAAVSKLGTPATSVKGLNEYAGQVLPISKKLATQLSALKAGSADRAKLNRLVSAVENGNQGLSLMLSATTTAQVTKASNLIVAKPVPKAANALGAVTCATSPAA